jgi:putative DNA primase/helicase
MLINFPVLKQKLRGHEEVILHHLLPNGRKQGRQYVALNPTRVDRNLGSFRINIHTQQWADFATEDRGGDLISLWAYVRNINNVEAAKQLLKLMER